MRALLAQLRAELTMVYTNGEMVLLTVGIPVVFLVFFATVHVLPIGTRHPLDFLVPGIVALSIMSTSMTALGIGAGFERGYGVLKRLGTTPLGRPRLLTAKILSVLGIEVAQVLVVTLVGIALGWHPGAGGSTGARGIEAGPAVAVIALGSIGFGGIALLLAGLLKPLVNLAVANGLFVVLLLLGGMLLPLTKFPTWLADVARVLPAAALANGLEHALGAHAPVTGTDWLVLAVWAVAAPVATALTFRWE